MKEFILIFLCVGLLSCHDNPPASVTSELTVNCTVMHHAYTVPFGRVYIKNGTTNWPGQNLALYDLSLPVDQSGRVIIEGLGSGGHVFYAIAYDSAVADSVSGYMMLSTELKPGEKKEVDLTIPVSE